MPLLPTSGSPSAFSPDEDLPTSEYDDVGFRVATVAGLAGDFNGNGVVDAADYVVWRKGLGTTFNGKGMQNYLLFFSIYQTCRNKGLSFLQFLRSGTFDMELEDPVLGRKLTHGYKIVSLPDEG